jgi:hypothetical protein
MLKHVELELAHRLEVAGGEAVDESARRDQRIDHHVRRAGKELGERNGVIGVDLGAPGVLSTSQLGVDAVEDAPRHVAPVSPQAVLAAVVGTHPVLDRRHDREARVGRQGPEDGVLPPVHGVAVDEHADP